MRLLVIDPFHGASGDMIIGALLSLIDEKEMVLKAMESVVSTPTTEVVHRCGITALKVHTHAPQTHRTSDQVAAIIKRANVPSDVIEQALKIFDLIKKAESKVHGLDVPYVSAHDEFSYSQEDDHDHPTHQVFFHEVGADDAIADIIGSCMALSIVKPDRIVVYPVATGMGTVKIQHGIVPVPAPATAAILAESNLITHLGGCEGELLTPTGAAILAEIATDIQKRGSGIIAGRITGIGYGAGTRDDPSSPNVLRMLLVEDNPELVESDHPNCSHWE